MVKKILGLVLFCACFLGVAAQSNIIVHGYVKDSLSGEALIGATILIDELNQGASTNAYGYYVLQLEPGSYTLNFDYLGYRTRRIALVTSGDTAVNVELAPVGFELDELVVSAKDKKEQIRSTAMSVQKLDMKTIRQIPVVFGETDILKSIQLLPGVSSIGDGTSGIFVRGGGADQNLILLDEGTIYNASHLFGFFSVFNSDAIKDVKVFKGGIPASYGGRLSSVIDVRQKEGNMRGFGGVAGIGLISSRLLVEAPIVKDKASFLLAGRRSYGDLFLAFTENKNRAFFYDLNLKSNYKFSQKSHLFLSAYLGNDVFTLADLFTNKWGNVSGTLRWNYIYNKKLFSNLSVIYSDYDYHFSFDVFDFDWTSTITNLNTKLDYTWFLNATNQINFGAQFQHYRFNPGFIEPNSAESAIRAEQLDRKYAREYGLYLDHQLQLGNRIGLRYGLRWSGFSRVGPETLRIYKNNQALVFNASTQKYEAGQLLDRQVFDPSKPLAEYFGLEPRINFNFTLNENTALKWSYNRIYQYIHLVSNTTSPTPLDIWTPSGPYIRPQRADQIALGYFQNLNNDRYEFSAEIYYKTLTGTLDYVDGAELVANNELETVLFQGDGRAYGIELLFRKTEGALKGWISYTLSKTQRRFEGLGENDPGVNFGRYYPAVNDRPHDLSLTASYHLSSRVVLGSNFVYQTGRPATFPQSKYFYSGFIVAQYAERNQSRLSDYHRLDLSMTLKSKRKEKKSNSEWVFSIYNIYNRRNAISVLFNTDEASRDVAQASRLAFFGILPSVSWNKVF